MVDGGKVLPSASMNLKWQSIEGKYLLMLDSYEKSDGNIPSLNIDN
jgi:hypothetical protein